MTAALVSAEHLDDFEVLLNDPIIIDMAGELAAEGITVSTLTHGSSGPLKPWFTTGAYLDYRQRGGKAGETSTSVARAVAVVLAIGDGEEVF